MLMQLLGCAESEWKCWLCTQREKPAVRAARPTVRVTRSTLPRCASGIAEATVVTEIYALPTALSGYDVGGLEAEPDADKEAVRRGDQDDDDRRLRTAQAALTETLRRERKEQHSASLRSASSASLSKARSGISDSSSNSSVLRSSKSQRRGGCSPIFEGTGSEHDAEAEPDLDDPEMALERRYNQTHQRIRRLPSVRRGREQQGVRAYQDALQSKFDRLGVNRAEQGEFGAHRDVAGVVREGVQSYYQHSETLGGASGQLTYMQRMELQRCARTLSKSGGLN